MIIGINGFKQVGKSTAAAALCENHDFEELSFADALKRGLAAIFNLDIKFFLGTDDEKNKPTWVRWDMLADPVAAKQAIGGTIYDDYITYREMMQLVATEVFRKWMPDIWVLTSLRGLDSARNYVFSDVRFINEIEAIKSSGGYMVEVTRPGHEGSIHASEQKHPTNLFDYQVMNAASLDSYLYAIDQIHEGLDRLNFSPEHDKICSSV